MHRDAGLLQAFTKITQGLVKLFLARHLLGHVELATDLVRGVKQGDFQSALGRFRSKRQTRRARTNHRHALFLGQGFADQNGFITSTRID